VHLKIPRIIYYRKKLNNIVIIVGRKSKQKLQNKCPARVPETARCEAIYPEDQIPESHLRGPLWVPQEASEEAASQHQDWTSELLEQAEAVC
jgi:hypothetical protein